MMIANRMHSLLISLFLSTAGVIPWASDGREQSVPQRETYQSASVDENGNLAIVRTDGMKVVIRKQGDQRSFAEPRISPDSTVVAAQALFPNCCTSYDLPLQLVLYSQGRERRLMGSDLPIFEW